MNLDLDHPLTLICQNFNQVWEISCSWCMPTTGSVGCTSDSSPIKGPRCFLQQELLPLLLSTGRFQEWIRA